MLHISKILPNLTLEAKASDSNSSSQPVPTMNSMVAPLVAAAPPASPPPSRPVPVHIISHDESESIKVIARHLARCFDVYPLYGREPEAAEGIHKTFIDTLAAYPPEAIEAGFQAFYRYGTEFPVPHLLVSIIERKNKPPFDKSVVRYIEGMPRDQRRSDDWDYLKGFATFGKHGRC